MQHSVTAGPTYTHEVRTYARNLQRIAGILANLLDSAKYPLLVLFSICYFVVTCYRASRKLFWFDELFTIHIANLPSVGAVWQALLHGADFNPPLLYLLTRWSQSIFGHTQLGARFPEIAGFWIFCLCLFRFVSVRTNALAGFVAMLFPMVTMAYWYSYEARSHGLVLAFCGLALICWQAAASRTDRRYFWIAGLAASLICAMLTHSYAFLLLAPIGIGELTRTVSTRRIDWLVWLSMALSSSAIFISVPLLHAVHASHGSHFLAGSPKALAATYQSLLQPATILLTIALILLCGDQLTSDLSANANTQRNPLLPGHFQRYEWAAILGSLVVPFFCFFASTLAGAPMLQRYSLQTVVGVACILGLAAARSAVFGIIVCLCLIAQIGIDFSSFRHGSIVEEPSTSIPLSTSPASYNERYEWMASNPHTNLPVLLLSDLEFSPAFYYAPSGLLPRLAYIPTDTNGEEYAALQRCCKAPGQIVSLEQLLSRSRSFLAYGPPYSYWIIEAFRRTGAVVSTERISRSYCLFLVEYPPGKPDRALELDRHW